MTRLPSRETRAGDLMQSSASRVLEWLREQVELASLDQGGVDPPYEVHMAMIELGDAIKDWTEQRRQHNG